MVDNGGAHGMQVFDLTQLRDVAAPPVTFAETAHYAGVTNTHTISITKETGYAYLVGSNTCGTGMHIVNLANPTSPQFVACYNDGGYIHENQCFVYHGPDTAYTGHEICLAARGSAHNLDIVDVTNHAAPVRLDSLHYNSSRLQPPGLVHRRPSLHPAQRRARRENGVTPTRTYIFDALDLDNLVLAGGNGYFSHATPAIDHNLYVRANFVFESNYTSGLRILALTDLAQAQLTEVGYFDLFPANNDDDFDGTWNNYPFFESGNIPVSHIEQGLFILRPTNLCTAPAAPAGFSRARTATTASTSTGPASGAPAATFKVQRALGGCGGTFETIAERPHVAEPTTTSRPPASSPTAIASRSATRPASAARRLRPASKRRPPAAAPRRPPSPASPARRIRARPPARSISPGRRARSTAAARRPTRSTAAPPTASSPRPATASRRASRDSPMSIPVRRR